MEEFHHYIPEEEDFSAQDFEVYSNCIKKFSSHNLIIIKPNDGTPLGSCKSQNAMEQVYQYIPEEEDFSPEDFDIYHDFIEKFSLYDFMNKKPANDATLNNCEKQDGDINQMPSPKSDLDVDGVCNFTNEQFEQHAKLLIEHLYYLNRVTTSSGSLFSVKQ